MSKQQTATISPSGKGAGVPLNGLASVAASSRSTARELLGVSGLLVLMVMFFLRGVFVPNNVMFSNDGPVGRLFAESHHLPERFTGCWQDLNIAGFREGSALPNLTFGLQWLLKPVWFSKFYAPVALVFLGLGAWTCFRQLKLAAPACILGALASTLNSAFFSVACWGIAAHTLTIGLAFFALAAVSAVPSQPKRKWQLVALAGFAAGMGVAEGADVGALFSLLIAMYVIHRAWGLDDSRAGRISFGGGQLVLVMACAGLIAFDAISDLVAYNIKGVAGAQQDALTKQGHWNWATQWSLPKREALGFVFPGLFGYLADTPGGGVYWGAIGQDAAWEEYFRDGHYLPPPDKLVRFSGGGFYAGISVGMVAFWAALQSLRRRGSRFNPTQKRAMWFWIAVSLLSLAFAFGRHAPFYRLLYGLPYFSTVRNPVKFVDLVCLSLVILFSYGVDGLWRGFMLPSEVCSAKSSHESKAGYRMLGGFEKKWLLGCGAVLAMALIGWSFYASVRPALERYLQTVLFDQTIAATIAAFSVRQVGWFVLFFAMAAALMASIFVGAFTGKKATLGCLALGVLVALDLGRANQPWIHYSDYKQELASNVIIDGLRQKPYEHRVAFVPYRTQPEPSLLEQTYSSLWMQHQFPFNNVQSLDVWQMPRKPADIDAFERVMSPINPFRLWQLTNTRYLLGPAGFLAYFNGNLDPVHHRLRLIQRFDFLLNPGVGTPTRVDQFTPAFSENGKYAVYELGGVLPRAKLYSKWQVVPDDQTALSDLASPRFDPQKKVLLTAPAGSALPVAATGVDGFNDSASAVSIRSYASKQVRLDATAGTPSILLLNDRFDPNWTAAVDDHPVPLLRCNYLMRGVYLLPGSHHIEFRYRPSVGPLRVSLLGLGAALLCLLFLAAPSPVRKQAAV